MGLKRAIKNLLRGGETPAAASSFERLSEEELEAHLGVARYGDFHLTDAVRPSYDLQVVPQEGFRFDTYRDEAGKTDVPVLMAAVSRQRLFETFLDLIDPLGSVVDVVLETSHNRQQRGHQDLYREHIDAPVLKSILWEFEELLLNDGCTGIAVLNPGIPQEVQFDEHKLLVVYGHDLESYESVFDDRRLVRRDRMKFITEAEHVHSSSDQFAREFEELQTRLGMDCGFN